MILCYICKGAIDANDNYVTVISHNGGRESGFDLCSSDCYEKYSVAAHLLERTGEGPTRRFGR